MSFLDLHLPISFFVSLVDTLLFISTFFASRLTAGPDTCFPSLDTFGLVLLYLYYFRGCFVGQHTSPPSLQVLRVLDLGFDWINESECLSACFDTTAREQGRKERKRVKADIAREDQREPYTTDEQHESCRYSILNTNHGQTYQEPLGATHCSGFSSV